MLRIILIASCLIQYMAYGQGWVPAGARSMSMANASTTFTDVWAFHNNPGALGAVESFSAGLSYENRFLLKELQSQGLAVAVPLKVGVISAGGHFYGYNQYRSTKVGIGYSLKLAEKLFAGVQLNYQGLRLSSNYGSKNSMTAEAGIYAKITDKWNLGLSAFNIGRAKLSTFEDDRFSTVLRLGSSYNFSKKLMLAIEAEKDLDYRMRFKSGLEYQVINNFYVRGGFGTAPVEATFGLGYHFKQIHLDLGSAYDQNLGWSPHFSIIFEANKK